jgi:hypothetical protein
LLELYLDERIEVLEGRRVAIHVAGAGEFD